MRRLSLSQDSRFQQKPCIGQTRQNRGPGSQHLIIDLGEVIETAEGHMPLAQHRRRAWRNGFTRRCVAQITARQAEWFFDVVRLIFRGQRDGICYDPIHRDHAIGIGITNPAYLHRCRAILHHADPAGLRMARQIHQNINPIGANLRDNRLIFQGAHGTPGIKNPAQPGGGGISAFADIIGCQMKPGALMRSDRRFQKIPNGMLAKVTGKHANAQPPIRVRRICEGGRRRAGKARGIGAMRRRHFFCRDARQVIQTQQKVLPGRATERVLRNGPALYRHRGTNIARLLQGEAIIHLGIGAIRQFFSDARQMGKRSAGLAYSHQRRTQFIPHHGIARRRF